jgi:hypothetical protein
MDTSSCHVNKNEHITMPRQQNGHVTLPRQQKINHGQSEGDTGQ